MKTIEKMTVCTTVNAIKMDLSAKQVEQVFKKGCGVSNLKPDGTASAILPIPVGVRIGFPFKIKMRCHFFDSDGVITDDIVNFHSFRLVKKAGLNSQAVWELYNARVTEVDQS